MFLRRFLFFPFFSAVLVFLAFEVCKAKETRICHPSSCGSLQNISYPFRLKTDPGYCGNHKYELACEENRAVLHLYSRRYHAEEINYDNLSMRVVDPGIQKDNCSSLPLYSLTPMHFKGSDPYDVRLPHLKPNKAITFISCPFPVNSSIFVDVTLCHGKSRGFSHPALTSSQTHSYVVSGEFTASDIKDSCTIGKKTLVSTFPTMVDNKSSFSGIHDAMAQGFELLWFRILCEECAASGQYCDVTENIVTCASSCSGAEFPFFSSSSCFWAFAYTFAKLCEDSSDSSSIYKLYRSLHLILFCFVISEGPVAAAFIIGAQAAMKILCGIPCVFVFLVYKFRRRHLSIHDNIEEFLQSQNNFMPIRYHYSQLKKITKEFKDKLGEGGFGSVYRGKLQNGYDVAIKLLGKSKSDGQDFINEVATIGRIHHANVVQLIGFCVERSKRALVYEFMANGSLAQHIFPQGGNVTISWEKMYEISLGVARGIEYLHRGCDMQILHFDIKPQNILLDESFAPKISDFGLAKLCSTDDSIVSLTAARGTMGYMAPELFYRNMGGISSKADVYSFGMLLMEMAGRRRNLNAHAENLSQIYFPSWVYDQLSNGEDIEIGDSTEEERKIVKKMIIVALWCIQMRPSERPSIAKVIEMLERTADVALEMPPKPFLSPQDIPNKPTPQDDSPDHRMLHIN